jgi:hypothetical protein
VTGTPEILSAFTPVSLEEMGRVRLMNRRDTKFVFTEEMLPAILQDLLSEYSVLEVNNTRALRYQTDYYDTPEFFHFQQHHNKHLNRYKVRTRRYLESNDSFFEIKFKNNHGRTIKERISLGDGEDGINERVRAFLRRKSLLNGSLLEHKLRVNYHRVTLVSKHQAERVTIDFDLSYSNGACQQSYERLIIAEVKQENKSRSPFTALMRKKRIRCFSISKYCLGIITLYSHVRHNLLKPKLRYLNKLSYATVRSS